MIVTALEKKGYLEIKRDAGDNRKFNLILSEKVKTVSTDMDKDIQNFISILYQGLTKEQLTAALTVLEKIEQNLALVERECHGETD
jgi:DNA-binding MarR family transcriptional regulator